MAAQSQYFFNPEEKPLSHAVELAVERVVTEVLAAGHITLLTPRALKHSAAAAYRGVGDEYARRERFEDIQRLRDTTDKVKAVSTEMGQRIDTGEIHPDDAAVELGIEFEPIKGPRFYRVGRSVFYDRAELDRWIERQRATVP